jgi:hypothetical protein
MLGFRGGWSKGPVYDQPGRRKISNLRRLAVEQGSDAPGRAYSSVGEIRSAVGETDGHELEMERFAASRTGSIRLPCPAHSTSL